MTTAQQPETFAITTSRGFETLMGRMGGAIAFTTYQAGKLFLLGVKQSGKLSVSERTFARCMGLAASSDGRSLLLATHYQIYRFENALPPGTLQGEHDAVYVPRVSWITGDIDAHDVGFAEQDRPVFANTSFNCLADVSDSSSFKPRWLPPFMTKLVREDCCHLNGMAMDGTVPRYATMVSRSTVSDGWRDRRNGGGLVIDVLTNEVVCDGLSMPHSPRLHDGKLWLLNSGAGEFGYVDFATGKFVSVAFVPGYARGLSMVGDLAIIGLSLARENRTFQGLPLDDALKAHDVDARCGLVVIDTRSGETVGWVRLEGVVRELYDVAFLSHVKCPTALGFKSDEITRVITIDDA